MDLYINQNGWNLAWSHADDSTNNMLERTFGASPNASYDADGVASYCVGGYGGYYGDGYYCEEAGELDVWVDTAPPAPYIDSTDPSSGNLGDNNVAITLYGSNLTYSNGSAPYIDFWPASENVSVGNVQVVNSGQITANYSIPSTSQTILGGFHLITDGGDTYGPDFEIDNNNALPPANITGLSPDTWTAGSSFTLTITGSNFGSNPTVMISGTGVSAGSAYNSDPGGTSTQVDVTVDASAPSGIATITVIPSASNGCVGNCFQNPGGGSNTNGSNSATATIGGATCPTAVTLDSLNTREQPLSLDDPPYLTGVGILTVMRVSPTGGNFSLDRITETVTPIGNTCPSSIRQYSDFPTITDADSKTFQIGGPPQGYSWESWSYLPPIPDAFYDSHLFKSVTNILGVGNVSSCQSTATQVYKCNGQPIGEFFLTSTFSAGTINGQGVTYVDVTKQ